MTNAYWSTHDREDKECPRAFKFLEELDNLCKAHGISISHEDRQGGFILEPYAPDLSEWMSQASVGDRALFNELNQEPEFHHAQDGRGSRVVMLDGKVITTECIEAHTGIGWVKVTQRDQDGNLILCSDGSIDVRYLTGVVTIEFDQPGEDE